jgi:predicted  nucleic acid-binding Zn-ribbon protein
MDLMNLEPLRALQSIDSAIQSLEKELDAFPKALEAARLDEAAVEAKHAVAKEALDAVQKRRRSLEREIEAVAENVRKYETEKTRVKTNEEFRALNNQIAHEKSRQSEIEDQVLFSFDEEATCAEREKTLQVELEAVKKATAAREAAAAAPPRPWSPGSSPATRTPAPARGGSPWSPWSAGPAGDAIRSSRSRS